MHSCKNNLLFTGKDLLDVRNSAGQTAFHLAVSEEMRQLLLDLQPPVESSFPDSQGLSNPIYNTIAALHAKICPQNRTDFYTDGLNSTPIIAYIFVRLHIASPRPLDRSLFVLCFLRQKLKKEFRIATVAIFKCDLYAAVFPQMSPQLPTKNCARLRTTKHNGQFYSFINKISFHGSRRFIFMGCCSASFPYEESMRKVTT